MRWIFWISQLVCSVALAQDAQPPTVPINLTAAASSSTGVVLNWTASTDNVAVTGYQVERCQGSGCSSSFTQFNISSAGWANSGLTASTTYGYRVRARDAVPNYSAFTSIVYVTTKAAGDTQAPTVPTNFTAAASSSTGVVLSWTASTDNVAVTGYQVERCQGSGCSSSFTTFNISSAGWANSGLTASTTYGYRVRARDAVPNYSAFTSIVYVTTKSATSDTQAPTVPANFTATPSSSTGVNVLWSAATDDVAVTAYQLERCQGSGCNSSFIQFNVTSTAFTDTGRSPSTTYGYRVRARDAVPNYSAFTSIVYIATPSAVGEASQSPSVTYDHDTRGRLATATFGDGTVVSYSYDDNGNRTAATVTPGTDTAPPTAPTGLTAIGASQTQVNLSWHASSDAVAVTGYRVERCAGANCTTFSQVATPTVTSHSDTGLSANTVYVYRVRAADAVGNLSAFSSTATVTTSGATAPSAPGTPSFNPLTMNSATASWTAASDDVGVTGYQYQLNSNGWLSLGNVLSVNLTGLSPGTSYTFSVRAQDSANNWGPAATASFTTPTDTSAPTIPTSLSASAPNASTVNLSWAASTDNVGVSGYRIHRGGTQIGTSASTSYSDTTVSGSTSYSYTVSAYDAVGNVSAQSSAANVTTPDTIAPSTPTGLSASAASATQVNLSWSASSDAGGSGLAGYRIYRNGTHITSVGSTSYSDTSVSPSTAYSYTVVAYDNANNSSGNSNTASVTTPSNVPATPGLSAQAGTNSSNFSVNWTVPSGPLSYYELEVTVNWGTPSYTTFYPPQTSRSYTGGDTDWDFRIRACNASSQCSAWSSTVSWHTCPVSGCP